MTDGIRPPEVTVVIPTCNRWPLLRRALRTALWQEDVEVEVIVVDDASTDETAERLGEIADERLRVVRHDHSQGVSAARNVAITQARAPWLAFLDDDDLWAPRKLRLQLDAAADGVALVFCGAVFIDGAGRVLHDRLPPEHTGDISSQLQSWNVVGSPSAVMARTSLVQRSEAFDTDLSIAADWDLWLRLSSLGQVVGVREVLMAYMLHSGNMHARDRSELLDELERIDGKLAVESPPRRLDVDSAALARLIAGGQRRAGQRSAAARTYLSSGARDLSLPNFGRGLALLAFGERPLSIGKRLREPRTHELPWLQAALRSDEL